MQMNKLFMLRLGECLMGIGLIMRLVAVFNGISVNTVTIPMKVQNCPEFNFDPRNPAVSQVIFFGK